MKPAPGFKFGSALRVMTVIMSAAAEALTSSGCGRGPGVTVTGPMTRTLTRPPVCHGPRWPGGGAGGAGLRRSKSRAASGEAADDAISPSRIFRRRRAGGAGGC